ncbi:MAG: hypothetical protein HOJ35_07495, partial [Bdellovibrionales bacterium]|nr:hypothetical protein [Bdellovibrionales bacterium]
LISISVKEEIKINKTVPLEFYFPEGSRTVEFINGNNINRVTIGNKLRYDRYFYLRYKQNNLEKIYLAYVDQPLLQMSSNNEYRLREKQFNNLLEILKVNEAFYYSRLLFNGVNAQVNQVKIRNFRSKDLLIDLMKLKTIPEIFNDLNYDQNKISSFKQGLLSLEAEEVFLIENLSVLGNKISEIRVTFQDKVKTISLYRKFNELSGYFAVFDNENILYELEGENAKIFFVNVQDFWVKSIWKTLNNDKSTDSISFSFNFFNESTSLLKAQLNDEFKIENLTNYDLVPSNISFYQLFDLLKVSADYVSPLDKVDIFDEYIFKINIFNIDLYLVMQKGEFIFIIEQLKLKFHYYSSNIPKIALELSDYFIN